VNLESKSYDDIEAAQELLNENDCGHWEVGSTAGTSADPLAFFTAQRIVSGGRSFQVTHRDAKTLLALAQEADARFAANDLPPIAVHSGTADTVTQGGTKS